MGYGLIAKKMGMSSLSDEEGRLTPVTILYAPPGEVIQVKSKDKEGYDAIQVGFFSSAAHRFSNAIAGHQKKATSSLRNTKMLWSILQEFTFTKDTLPAGQSDSSEPLSLPSAIGQNLSLDIFKKGQRVFVQGISKGKGFQGAMKRHGFGGGRATHGSGFHRAPGSLGASATPSRVFKGKKMPGRMGGKSLSVANLKIIEMDKEKCFLFVKGAVPGPTSSYVRIESSDSRDMMSREKQVAKNKLYKVKG